MTLNQGADDKKAKWPDPTFMTGGLRDGLRKWLGSCRRGG